MRFSFGCSFDSGSRKAGPIVANHVLNKQECGVVAIGTFCGDLVYRNKGSWLTSKDISHVYFHSSSKLKNNRTARSVTAEFDIYTLDGRVIEVSSCDRATIQAALEHAPVTDVRAGSRHMRGL